MIKYYEIFNIFETGMQFLNSSPEENVTKEYQY